MKLRIAIWSGVGALVVALWRAYISVTLSNPLGTGGIGRSTDMRVDLHQRLYEEGRAAQRPTFQAGHAGSIPVTRSPRMF